jgi:hypothetical protein
MGSRPLSDTMVLLFMTDLNSISKDSLSTSFRTCLYTLTLDTPVHLQDYVAYLVNTTSTNLVKSIIRHTCSLLYRVTCTTQMFLYVVLLIYVSFVFLSA